MVLLESLKLPLFTKMPEFNLKDPFGVDFSSQDLMGEKGLLVIFTLKGSVAANPMGLRIERLANSYTHTMSSTCTASSTMIGAQYPHWMVCCPTPEIKTITINDMKTTRLD